MKISKVTETESPLYVPDDCYTRGGDIAFYVETQKQPIVTYLPSLRGEVKNRCFFKIFIYDFQKNSENNPITISTPREEEKINGVNKFSIKTNGGCVMIVPMGENDWFCFVPSLPSYPALAKKSTAKSDADLVASDKASTSASGKNGTPAVKERELAHDKKNN